MKETFTPEVLGTKLRELRNKAKKTAKEIGEVIGISGASISKIESGITDVNYSRLLQLCRVYEVEVYELFDTDQLDLFGAPVEDPHLVVAKAEIEELKTANLHLTEKVSELKDKLIRLLDK